MGRRAPSKDSTSQRAGPRRAVPRRASRHALLASVQLLRRGPNWLCVYSGSASKEWTNPTFATESERVERACGDPGVRRVLCWSQAVHDVAAVWQVLARVSKRCKCAGVGIGLSVEILRYRASVPHTNTQGC
eukprot:350318-Chlamydomonas_euryale.AAC.8